MFLVEDGLSELDCSVCDKADFRYLLYLRILHSQYSDLEQVIVDIFKEQILSCGLCCADVKSMLDVNEQVHEVLISILIFGADSISSEILLTAPGSPRSGVWFLFNFNAFVTCITTYTCKILSFDY